MIEVIDQLPEAACIAAIEGKCQSCKIFQPGSSISSGSEGRCSNVPSVSMSLNWCCTSLDLLRGQGVFSLMASWRPTNRRE